MRQPGSTTDLFRRPSRRKRPFPGTRPDVLAVISAGGALGAVARYGLGRAIPRGPADFPWPTFVVNVTGCLVIGVFMVAITEAFAAHRLLRPFLGVGVLGGFTTFSTYTVDGVRLVRGGDYRIALLYVLGTMLACLLAVVLGVFLMRRAFRWVEHAKEQG